MLVNKAKLLSGSSVSSPAPERKKKVHLTQYEYQGLNLAVQWLQRLAPTKKMVPKDIPDPDGLLKDIKVGMAGVRMMEICTWGAG